MKIKELAGKIATLVMVASVFAQVTSPIAGGQTPSPVQTAPLQSPGSKPGSVLPADPGDEYFRAIYRDFYNNYKLGPDDQIALRVKGQPDYSLEQVTVSPVGRIYHPLLGDLDVAGLTVPKLTEKLTIELSQYIIEPTVSISLLTANSAKIGVLGDVPHPGVLVMARPMTLLDAISASGGIADTGSKSNVTLLRQIGEGRMFTRTVNVKRILEGKSEPEENLALKAGDTIIVHGNLKKKISSITSLMGFGNFVGFVRGW